METKVTRRTQPLIKKLTHHQGKIDGCWSYFRENRDPNVEVKSATSYSPEKRSPMKMAWISATDIYNNSLVRGFICYLSSKCPQGLKEPKENIFKIINECFLGWERAIFVVSALTAGLSPQSLSRCAWTVLLCLWERSANHTYPSWPAQKRAKVS